MRIAMIGQKGIPCRGGGVERHVEELSIELVRAGHEVVVYTRPHYTSPKLKQYEGVTLVSLPSLVSKHLDAITHTLFSTCDAIARRVDIIHYHGIGPALLSFIPRIVSPRIRVVGTFHSADWLHEKWSKAAQLMLKIGSYMISFAPHATIAVSRDIARLIKSKTGRRALYIPSGVRVYDSKPSRTRLASFKIGQVPYILIASRFVQHKCIHEAIEAFIKMKEGGKFPRRLRDLKLVLAGGGSFTDAYVAELKSLANGRRDIVFTGFQGGETMRALFAHAAVFIQPSVAEGRSISLMEAAAWGVPIAAADITETRELLLPDLSKKPYGVLFTSHDRVALAQAMLILLTRREAAIRMGARARDYMRQAYQWEKIASWVDAVYLRLSVRENNFEDIEYELAKAEAR